MTITATDKALLTDAGIELETLSRLAVLMADVAFERKEMMEALDYLPTATQDRWAATIGVTFDVVSARGFTKTETMRLIAILAAYIEAQEDNGWL